MKTLTKKTKLIIAAVVVAVCLFAALFVVSQNNLKGGESPDAPPVMPAGHAERYQTLSVAGCYGCHGSNSSGTTNLKAATPLPADHYANGEKGTSYKDIAGEHTTCITCHVPATTK